MYNKPAKINSQAPLHVIDPDLPFLASKAAIELDNLILGRTSDLKSVNILAEKLRHSFEIDETNGERRSLLDPTTLTILGEAINKSETQPTVTKEKDLINKAWSIADELLQEKNLKDDSGRLEWARAFCVALSSLTAAYHRSIFDLRPPHPFRRLMKW